MNEDAEKKTMSADVVADAIMTMKKK